MKLNSLLILLLLASCASLSKNDCELMNWSNKGQDDASQLEDIAKITEYEEQCRAHGLKADRNSYIAGYRRELPRSCTFDNAYLHGKRGNPPFAPCEKISSQFRSGYHKGREEYYEEKLQKQKDEMEEEAAKKLNEKEEELERQKKIKNY